MKTGSSVTLVLQGYVLPRVKSVIKLDLLYKVPSLNRLFSMNHWQRHKERHKAHLALLSALLASGGNRSTQTTSQEVPNTSLMAYDTLASYLTTHQKRLGLKSRRGKRNLASQSTPKSPSPA